jgi:protein SCO1/2
MTEKANDMRNRVPLAPRMSGELPCAENNREPPARQTEAGVSRRDCIAMLAGAALNAAMPRIAQAHAGIGPVRPPVFLPDAAVTRHDGARATLQTILSGKTTALQLMFTSCSATCPLQGAVFAGIQQKRPNLAAEHMQLVSLSIDPLGDDPQALAAWLRRFDARAGWTAVVPAWRDLDAIRAGLQRNTGRVEDHSTQVYLFNTKGALIWRTGDLPSAQEISTLLLKASRLQP